MVGVNSPYSKDACNAWRKKVVRMLLSNNTKLNFLSTNKQTATEVLITQLEAGARSPQSALKVIR